MAADPLLHAAVIDDARWCNAVCRSHGYPGQFTGRLWTSVRHALLYPNAITLSPDATVAEVTAETRTRLGLSRSRNVFKSGIAGDPLWAGAVRTIARVRPGLPIVGSNVARTWPRPGRPG